MFSLKLSLFSSTDTFRRIRSRALFCPVKQLRHYTHSPSIINFADSLLQSVAISQRNDAITYAYDFYTRASFRWKNTHPIGSGSRSRRVVEPKTKLQQTPLWFNKLGKKIVIIRELSFIITDYVYSRSWLVSSLATV